MRPAFATALALALSACAAPTVPTEAAPLLAAEIELPPGTTTFDLDLKATASVDPSELLGNMNHGELALHGVLALSKLPGSGARTRLQLMSVSAFSIEFGDDAPDPDRTPDPTGCTAWADLSDGPPEQLQMSRQAHGLCRHLMTHIALSLDFRDRAAAGGQPVLTSYGPMHALYSAGVGSVTREALGATDDGAPTRARSVIGKDADGRIESLSAHLWLQRHPDPEVAPLASTTVVLQRSSMSPELPELQDKAELATHTLLPAVDGTQQRLAEARAFANGLDRGMLGLYVAHVEQGGKLPQGFAIRARGLMLAEPGLAHEVAAAFAGAQRSVTRALIADLLSQAPTPEAQAELRALVRKTITNRDDDRGQLLQRLGLLDRPDRASAELAVELHDDALRSGDDRTRRAALHVLGMLGRAVEPTAPDVTAKATERLIAGLGAEQTSNVRLAAMAGLGNLGDADHFGLIVEHLAHEDDQVRAGATLALRRMPHALAVPLLNLLTVDRSPHVVDAARVALSYSQS